MGQDDIYCTLISSVRNVFAKVVSICWESKGYRNPSFIGLDIISCTNKSGPYGNVHIFVELDAPPSATGRTKQGRQEHDREFVR